MSRLRCCACGPYRTYQAILRSARASRGVPTGAVRYCDGGSAADRRTRGADFVHTRGAAWPEVTAGCPALTSGAIRSPSTSGAFDQGNNFRVDLMFARSRAIVRPPVPGGCDSCGSVAGAPHAQDVPARGAPAADPATLNESSTGIVGARRTKARAGLAGSERRQALASREAASAFRDTPCSAARIARRRCTSSGTRTWNLPE
jgi:hypothetical protein